MRTDQPTPSEFLEETLRKEGIITIATPQRIVKCAMDGTASVEENITGVTSMVVASFGFHLLNLPEIIICAGPMIGELPVSEAMLVETLDRTDSFIKASYAAALNGTSFIRAGDVAGIGGRIYVCKPMTQEEVFTFYEGVPTVVAHYSDADVENFLIFLPQFSDDRAIFKTCISKKRH